jgi:general secretion pathway protein N
VKRTLVIGVLAVLAFAVILIARLPASWVVPSSPASKIACADAGGTIWNGGCTGLTFQGQNVGDVTWVLHPLPLLSGKVAAHAVLTRAPGLPGAAGAARLGQGAAPSAPAHAEADVETNFSGKDLTARNVKADFSFDPTLAPQLHMPFLGNLHADLSQVQVKNGALAQVQGEVQVHDLRDGRDNMELGSYSLTFPGGAGEQTARLRDLGGPLAIEGTVRFTNEPGVVVDGLVAPRPTASEDLLNQLRILGTPDAQGRRPFSFASTF